MAQTALKDEEFTFPAGGIADFYMEDDDIAALEREEAEQAFGKAGIAEFGEVASRMASYGRGGDDTIAHVATGEIIIPLPLIENNPRMKASIFNHLRELGVEDPEQYVVGSSANSINPETGLAEFGWFKKIVRKVKKAVKKVVKTVKKVVKKVAPIVLPAIGSMIFGPIYGAAFGSGIATLINGGSIKDAFKSALISGGTGALFSGVSGAISGEGFMSGISNAANPANLTEGFSNIGKAFTGDFSGVSFANMKGGPASEGGTSYKALTEGAQLSGPEAPTYDVAGKTPVSTPTSTDQIADKMITRDPATGALKEVPVNTQQAITQSYTPPRTVGESLTDMFTDIGPGDKSFLDASKDLFMPAGPTPAQVQLAQNEAFKTTLAQTGSEKAALEAMKNVTSSSIGPSLFRTFGPGAAAGTALAAGAGFFDAPKDPPVDTPPTGEELVAADPEKYRIADLEVRRSEGPTEVASPYTIVPGQGTFVNPFYRPQDPRNQPIYAFDRQYAAEGGEIFPRRVGGIMPNEGIPGQDSVRAMLMPGEFVMTTDAVKGLGGGNMRQGINNMYDMMRGLESRGKAMA